MLLCSAFLLTLTRDWGLASSSLPLDGAEVSTSSEHERSNGEVAPRPRLHAADRSSSAFRKRFARLHEEERQGLLRQGDRRQGAAADRYSRRQGAGSGGLAAAYVHWGSLSALLWHGISLTLSWGTDVWLVCDFNVEPTKVKRTGSARLRTHPVNTSGSEQFKRNYHRMVASDRVFQHYPAKAEYLNEVRFRVLLNFLESTGLEEVVYLDSDVALLVPASIIFDPTLYAGCDAVITFNQVSSRVMPVHAQHLDAYWAGTGRLSRRVLRDYVTFQAALWSDPVMHEILLTKMRTLPTINDMTTWCLFTIATGFGHSVPQSLLDRIAASSMGNFKGRHRVCNTQPQSWSGQHGIVQSASGEIGGIGMHTVFREGARFFVDGDVYLEHFKKLWASDYFRVAEVGPGGVSLAGRLFQLYTLHYKKLHEAATFSFLQPATLYNGSFSDYGQHWEAQGNGPLRFELRQGKLERYRGVHTWALQRTGTNSAQWVAEENKNIPIAVQTGMPCGGRYATLKEAKRACERLSACQGVVKDMGVACKNERGE